MNRLESLDDVSAEVTVVVPSLNHAAFLPRALDSLLAQSVRCEIFVVDGGSTDGTREVLKAYADRIAGWRSHVDAGQSAAINEGIQAGRAPFVCWLNADDELLPDALVALRDALRDCNNAPVAYGGCEFMDGNGRTVGRHPTFPFSRVLLANFCFIGQPATLIRRTAWEAVGGLDESLQMALDYDLWWRLARDAGRFVRVPRTLARTRMHPASKTYRCPRAHYSEAMQVVRTHYGRIPLKWYLAWPFRVWLTERNHAIAAARGHG